MKIVPPAHKHVGDAGKPGQTVYGFDRHPYLKTPKVQTLGDYVKKVVKEESNTQPEGALTDEQVADTIECEFSATGEWPEGDPAIVRAFLKHWRQS